MVFLNFRFLGMFQGDSLITFLFKIFFRSLWLFFFKEFTKIDNSYLLADVFLMNFLVVFFHIIFGVIINSLNELFQSSFDTVFRSFAWDLLYFQWYSQILVHWAVLTTFLKSLFKIFFNFSVSFKSLLNLKYYSSAQGVRSIGYSRI